MAFLFVASTLVSFVFPIFMHIGNIRLFRFIFGSLAMTFLTPTFINVFVLYAIANLHDISWGNRPKNAGISAKEQDHKDKFEIFRFKVLFWWLLANIAFAYCVIQISSTGQHGFILVFSGFVAAVLWLRLLFALLNRLLSCCRQYKLKKHITKVQEDHMADAIQDAQFEEHWELEERAAKHELDILK